MIMDPAAAERWSKEVGAIADSLSSGVRVGAVKRLEQIMVLRGLADVLAGWPGYAPTANQTKGQANQ